MMLYGSSVLSAMIYIDHKEVQLGDVVRYAVKTGGYTTEEWNDLPDLQREYKLVDAIYDMRAEASKNNMPTSIFCNCCGNVSFPHNCPGVMF